MKILKNSNTLIALAAILLIGTYFFPLWNISLGAPQYPNELEMYIWLNKITGDTEYTIQNINILNHYIGMKAIEPGSFPELTYMPFVVAALVLLGLLVAFFGQKWTAVTWIVTVVVVSTIGLYDFYAWETEFGSNLDPRAPIKLEGMTYSPPFLGTKVLLNIVAKSYPGMAVAFLSLSMLVAAAAIWSNRFTPLFGKNERASGGARKLAYGPAVVLAAVLLSCSGSNGPQGIKYGKDLCHFCKMTVVDEQFAAQMVNKNGKAFNYDAIECLARHLNDDPSAREKAAELYVTNWETRELIPAGPAFYVKSKEILSPMGGGVLAVGNSESAASIADETSGKIMSWKDVLAHYN